MAKHITTEELKSVLRHYWKMRNWAKHQSPNSLAVMLSMKENIGEHWGGRYCVLCNQHFSTHCKECPLFMAGHDCNNRFSVWRRMDRSFTWGIWVVNATEMANVIIELPRQVECPECDDCGGTGLIVR